MTTTAIIRYTGLTPQPWKNGLGITRTILSDSGVGSDNWTWKISIAEISGTQPYSPYPGVRRGQVALGPGAVDLVVNGAPVLLPVEGTIVFEGEDEVSATPQSEGFLDLNVMGYRECWEPSVRIVDSPKPQEGRKDLQLLIALEDTCTINGARLARLDAVQLMHGAPANTAGRFVLASLTHKKH